MLNTLTAFCLVSTVKCFWSSQDCLVSQWSSWTNTGNGTMTRTRSVLRYPIGTGKPCPSLTETSVDCQVSEWSTWERSTNNKISRTRKVQIQPQGSGKVCPPLLDVFNTSALKTMRVPEAAQTVLSSAMFAFGYRPSATISRLETVQTGDARDLLIIVDVSGSVRRESFSEAMTHLSYFLKLLCPLPDPFDSTKPGFQQLAMITFSDHVREVFDFDTHRSLTAIQRAVKQAPYIGQMTCTEKAFSHAQGMFSAAKGARIGKSGVLQEVLIITDGFSNCGDARAAAKKLKKETGANVYGLMVGNFNDAGISEVADYVSDPVSEHLFRLAGYVDFKAFVEFVEKKLNEYNTPCAPFNRK